MHSRKPLLFSNDEIWVKNENPDFDVTMEQRYVTEVFNGAEVCELVDLYLLNTLKKDYGRKNIGFYRNDGLTCFENKLEKIKKNLCQVFNDNSLNIAIE